MALKAPFPYFGGKSSIADYRGSISMIFNVGYGGCSPYKAGDRIGQIVFVPIPDVELVEASELSETERGTGGYGSTGK